AYDRTLRYSIDDLAHEAVSGTGVRTRFWYGSDGARYKREDGSKKTLYLGNVEIVTDAGVTTTRRTIAGVMLQTVVGVTVTNHYLFHDQLGNLVKVTNASGVALNSQDYAAFGQRRDYADPMLARTSIPTVTTRGFTGHEMVDGVLGIIHMNGRIYDPALGRFLQADPLIQAPDNAQSWNAYTYCFNNPYRYTDPTGMLGQDERMWIATAIIIVASIWTGGAAGATGSLTYAQFGVVVAAGFASGAIATKSLQGGVMGAFTALLGAGMGGAAGGGFSFAEWGARTFVGGVLRSLQGGEFGHAFLSAGLTAAFMPQVGTIGNAVGRTVTGAIVGGTISRLTGGKFANGAVSGAIQGAMAGGRSRTAAAATEEDVGSTPPGIEKNRMVARRASFTKTVDENGVLTYSADWGEYSLAYGGGSTRDQAVAYASSIEESWNFDRFVDGIRYRSALKVNVTDSSWGADLRLSPCTPTVCEGMRGAAWIRGRDFFWGSYGTTLNTPGHEFGHILGFTENGGGARYFGIMGGRPNKSVSALEMGALYNVYGR
nr:hypothetical protein [bacterium]